MDGGMAWGGGSGLEGVDSAIHAQVRAGGGGEGGVLLELQLHLSMGGKEEQIEGVVHAYHLESRRKVLGQIYCHCY